jgi:hypothetical protein
MVVHFIWSTDDHNIHKPKISPFCVGNISIKQFNFSLLWSQQGIMGVWNMTGNHYSAVMWAEGTSGRSSLIQIHFGMSEWKWKFSFNGIHLCVMYHSFLASCIKDTGGPHAACRPLVVHHWYDVMNVLIPYIKYVNKVKNKWQISPSVQRFIKHSKE